MINHIVCLADGETVFGGSQSVGIEGPWQTAEEAIAMYQEQGGGKVTFAEEREGRHGVTLYVRTGA